MSKELREERARGILSHVVSHFKIECGKCGKVASVYAASGWEAAQHFVRHGWRQLGFGVGCPRCTAAKRKKERD